MVIEKLRTLSKRQYEKLVKLGIGVTEETTVQEVLKFMRTPDAIDLINYDAPMYCNIHAKGYYIAEVLWYGEGNKVGEVCWQSWKSNAVKDWEFAESLALDYMLKLEISVFDDKAI
jgi:hypothetical protein